MQRTVRDRRGLSFGAKSLTVRSAGGLTGKRKGPDCDDHTSAEPTRRDFLYIATGAVGAVGAAAVAWPLIAQMNPDASTIAAGAPIEVDLAPIAEGQVIKVFWRGKPIFISHRTKKEIEEAQKVDVATLPDPQPDEKRVKPGKDQWLVLIGICTHLGCIPLAHQGNVRRLLLPVPRLALRHLRPHPAGSGAGQSSAAALRIRLRHQDPDRLTHRAHHRPGLKRMSGHFDLPAAKRLHEMDGAPPADRAA